MNRIQKTACTLALAAMLVPVAIPAQDVDTGDADFSKYVALGDSLTAGYTNGGLAERFQTDSYPQLIFRQVKGSKAGFQQPLVSEPGIPPLSELKSLVPLVIGPKSGQGQPLNLTLPRPYDNLGIPSATTHGVLTRKSGDFFDLVLRPSVFPFTPLEQALALDPTFVTVWLGSYDILRAGTSGIVIDGVTLTTKASFEQDFRTIIGALAGSGAQLAIANVPSVTAIPFFNTIPPVVLNPATNEPVLVNGNPVPLLGPGGSLTPADKVLLTASGLLAQGVGIPASLGGTGEPLPDEAVLSASEVAAVEARTNQFNEIIRTVASESGAALVDIHAVFNRVAAEGYELGGIEFTTDFLTGGIFAYDGVHATRLGYGIVAELFVEAINAQYDANIPSVDLAEFVFSPDTALPPGAAPANQAILNADAVAQLYYVMGLPPIEKLLKIKRSREIPELPTPGFPEGGTKAPRSPRLESPRQ